MKLPVNLETDIVQYLSSLPGIEVQNTRRALINTAGLDEECQRNIQFGESAVQFFSILVPNLVNYGTLDDGRNALEAILEASKKFVGKDRRKDCDILIQQLREYLSTTTHQEKTDLETTEGAFSKQTFVPGYQHDVFVSYVLTNDQLCYVDGQGWIRKTVETLEEDVKKRFQGQRKNLVWGAYTEFTPEIVPILHQSATVVVILSQQYMESSWGKMGEKSFLTPLQACLDKGRKVFVVKIDNVEYPLESDNIIKYNLWEEKKKEDLFPYYNAISEIARDLTDELRELSRKADIIAKKQQKAGGTTGTTVFIDRDPVDSLLAEELSKKLRKELDPLIYFPFTSSDFPDALEHPSEYKEWFDTCVLNCDGLLLVYGKVKPIWVQRQLQEIIKLSVQRTPFTYAIYDGPPEEKPSLPLSLPTGGIIVDCRKCPDLAQKCEQSSCRRQFVMFMNSLKIETDNE